MRSERPEAIRAPAPCENEKSALSSALLRVFARFASLRVWVARSSYSDSSGVVAGAATGTARFFGGPEYHLREIHMKIGDARKIDE